MMDRYYQQELSNLRELAIEFAKAHPALAPMLSGPSQDPDVERLLEGTAFLTGLLRNKLDDEFPELIHGLARLVFPHYLRPIPAATTIQFVPQSGLTETLSIPVGSALASVPIEGTQCIFRTCYQVQLQPIRLMQATLKERPGRPSLLTLRFSLIGLNLDQWYPDHLRLHFPGPIAESSMIWNLLAREVDKITISPVEAGGSSLVLDNRALHQVGFGPQEHLMPYPTHAFSGYRIIQEYFILPEKFLYLDITGLEQWQDRGKGGKFDVTFKLKNVPPDLPLIKKERFALFATPAINLFPYEAEPITYDQRQPEYHIFPAGNNLDHYQVFSVERVTGFTAGTLHRREYKPFEIFSPQNDSNPVFNIRTRPSLTRSGVDVLLSVAFPPATGEPKKETISIDLMCTNARLPERLQYGDICRPTSTSPNLCDYMNIRPPTSSLQPPLGGDLLWQLLSHLSLNFMSLASADNLKALLRLYVFAEGRDRADIVANERRIGGIEGLKTQLANRLVSGLIMRGQHIVIDINPRHFASLGDMLLFGSVLDHFLASYANLNTFTQLMVKNTVTGEVTAWQAMIGDRPLI